VDGLPSWVSDWKRESQSLLHPLDRYAKEAKHTAAITWDPTRPGAIFVEGWQADKVQMLGDAMQVPEQTGVSEINQLMQAWHNAARLMVMQHATSYPEEERLEVYIRTVIGNRKSDIDTAVPTAAECLEMERNYTLYASQFDAVQHATTLLEYVSANREVRKHLSQNRDSIEPNIWQLLMGPPGTTGVQQDQDVPASIRKVEGFVEQYGKAAVGAGKFLSLGQHRYGNRFCVTVGGRAAIVPSRTCVGDVICFFKGARMPYLVRPQGEDFELIGCCYVYGMMEWEEMGELARRFCLV